MIILVVFLAAANAPVADDPGSGRALTSLDFGWRVNVTYAVPKPHHDQRPVNIKKRRKMPVSAIQPSLSLDLLKDLPWTMPHACHAELAEAHAAPMH